jgi:hypothetical protein
VAKIKRKTLPACYSRHVRNSRGGKHFLREILTLRSHITSLSTNTVLNFGLFFGSTHPKAVVLTNICRLLITQIIQTKINSLGRDTCLHINTFYSNRKRTSIRAAAARIQQFLMAFELLHKSSAQSTHSRKSGSFFILSQVPSFPLRPKSRLFLSIH